MKIRLIKYALSILAITFVMTSCSKTSDELASVASTKQDILTFKTTEEFNSTVQKVNSMKTDERISWEKSQGFKSFGTICNDFYATINPQDFKTIKEIEDFVAKNNDKIQIYVNKDGDKYCEVQEFDNSARYLMNKEKMYIVGSTVVKQFLEGTVSTDIANIDVLKNAKSYFDLNANLTSGAFKIGKQKSAASTVFVQSDEVNNEHIFNEPGLFGTHAVKYRLVVRFKAENTFDGSMTFNHYFIQVTNYYWGVILFGVNPGFSTTYNATIYTEDYNPLDNFSFNKYETTATIIEHTPLNFYLPLVGGNVNTGVHLLRYVVTGSNIKGCSINADHTY